jgi:hypothetical protein
MAAVTKPSRTRPELSRARPLRPAQRASLDPASSHRERHPSADRVPARSDQARGSHRRWRHKERALPPLAPRPAPGLAQTSRQQGAWAGPCYFSPKPTPFGSPSDERRDRRIGIGLRPSSAIADLPTRSPHPEPRPQPPGRPEAQPTRAEKYRLYQDPRPTEVQPGLVRPRLERPHANGSGRRSSRPRRSLPARDPPS